MFGDLNPKKMQAAMKQLGMSQEEISASRVTIEKSDNNKIIIENPTVVKLKIQGQESFQISGEVKEEQIISEEDIKTIVEKTNASKEEARKALENAGGDLAETILKLSE
ncbi:MAG TPA: nascent polypeptide-associated complex protein [Candidatus Pacearchaeota archaeon]|nr:nascent polypeptide-associated complex protein [Candidatus Pacearchaeota archaeon]